MTSSRTDDEGSVTLLVLAAATGMVLLLPLAGTVASAIAVHHRMDAAADLAALSGALDAGVGDACAAAQRVAEANGGLLAGCAVDGDVVTVTVEPAQPPAGVPFRLSSRARATAQ